MGYKDFSLGFCGVIFWGFHIKVIEKWKKTMKPNLISKCLTFYVLLETCPAEAVLFTVVNGFWFSSSEKKKKEWGEKECN